MTKPLCFVLMPFGRKKDSQGREVDFDAVYGKLIAPAIEAAGMEAIRADQEQMGGTIHKPMFERLMLCEYAVADVTGANPNVYYELGVRHALRPRSTVILFAEGTTLPFDVSQLRGRSYAVTEQGALKKPKSQIESLTAALKSAHADPESIDSPLFQLIADMPRTEIAHAKTDTFREKAAKDQAYRDELTRARKKGPQAVRRIADGPDLADLRQVESGVIVDLMLSFRAVEAYQEMVELYDRMPRPVQRSRMIREQLGFALNRLKRSDEAEAVLSEVVKDFGASSETSGLLGRIYKDRWKAARAAGRMREARANLKYALDNYLAGFEADWRDAYPGINAVTMMEMLDKPDPRQADILTVVRYAARQRAAAKGDYWDHATLLEIAVLGRDRDEAETQLGTALAIVRETWEPATTADNLTLIRDQRRSRGEETGWIDEIIGELEAARKRFLPDAK